MTPQHFFLISELQKLGTWLRSNKIAFNTGKTKIMIFYPKGKRVPDNVVFHLIIMILVRLIFRNLFIPMEKSLILLISSF